MEFGSRRSIPRGLRLALLVGVVGVYALAASPLRSAAARVLAAGYDRIAAPGVQVRSTPSPVAIRVTTPDEAPRALAVPFGRVWLAVTVALAAGGIPTRSLATVAGTALGISAVELSAAAIALAGVPALWHLVDAARLVDLPLLVGVALWLWNAHRADPRPETLDDGGCAVPSTSSGTLL